MPSPDAAAAAGSSSSNRQLLRFSSCVLLACVAAPNQPGKAPTAATCKCRISDTCQLSGMLMVRPTDACVVCCVVLRCAVPCCALRCCPLACQYRAMQVALSSAMVLSARSRLETGKDRPKQQHQQHNQRQQHEQHCESTSSDSCCAVSTLLCVLCLGACQLGT